MFSIMAFIFPLFFIIVFGIIIFSFIKGIGEWSKNNKEPILNVDAKVVTKRANTSQHHHNNDNMHHTTNSTSYFVTFEVQSGDRMELLVSAKDYGMIAEGDYGNLVFQGTRFHAFDREL